MKDLETEQYIKENTLGGQLETLSEKWHIFLIGMAKELKMYDFLEWLNKKLGG